MHPSAYNDTGASSHTNSTLVDSSFILVSSLQAPTDEQEVGEYQLSNILTSGQENGSVEEEEEGGNIGPERACLR
jgi:hypothetical protein